MEVWRQIKGYEGLYDVSSYGRIRSYYSDKVMQPCIDSSGYNQVWLSKNKERKIFLLHRLLLETFRPKAKNKETVNHIDGNKLNNRIDNLEWSSLKSNIQHAYDTGLIDVKNKSGELNGLHKLTNKGVAFIRKSNLTTKELSKIFSVDISTINRVKKGISWNIIKI